jgi:hypothetical protein
MVLIQGNFADTVNAKTKTPPGEYTGGVLEGFERIRRG